MGSEMCIRDSDREIQPIRIVGKLNFLWLACIVLAVALAPSVDLHAIFEGHAHWNHWIPFREIVMLSVAGISLASSDKKVRYEDNKFEWGPIMEVAALFIGIFLAMIPALTYLAQVAPTLPLNEVTFFAFTGTLSSVLDNAPTYVTFFEMAKTLPGQPRVADVPEIYLVPISLGAVFCGAITYIGNGPNFMVKSIAESADVEMPSFGGYTLKWAFRYLLPILLIMVMIFVVQDWRIRGLGIFFAVLRVAQEIWQASRYPDPHKHKAT